MSPRRQMTYSRRPNHAARSAHARGARQFKTYDTSYIRPKQSKAPLVFAAVVTIAIVVAAVFAISTMMKGCSGSGAELIGPNEQATITVEAGESAKTIGDTLCEAGLIARSSDFSSRVDELGVADQLKPGSYTFAGETPIDDIIAAIQAGPQAESTLTVPEGYKLTDIAAAVAEATEGRVSAEDFTAAASNASVYAADYSFLADAGENSLEGFLFPKTYELDDTATADSIIRMMLDQFNAEFSTLDLTYPQSVGLNVYDVVKLASIVEKESTGSDDIRAQVAGVFYNRLTNEFGETAGYLQSDATTAYVVGHDPSPEEVHADDPYSTYTYKGLPPTPICSPGLACLKAVCSPIESDNYYFYFWNGEDGTLQYAFSRTYDEHQAAIANTPQNAG
ncbi:endolytic transglycosylase MltG [Adlercreutzia sp. ZJ141]|uniref:endolytic transglycosylase MltG n=1 Tax=Adlercreutzia sp. ZJ141 TaxID=2709406 RepID=UPI0013EE2869|nr:endolytic transglycosylase MltG [Adlercreutzia sp. ZJ141]